MLGGDILEHLLVNVFRREFGERIVQADGVRPKHAEQRLQLENVLGADGRVNLLQLRVVGGSQKRERSGQRPGADAGDQFEIRPLAGGGPSAQQARAERPIAAAPRDRQDADGVALPKEAAPLFLMDRFDHVFLERRTEGVAPGPHTRQARNLDSGLGGFRRREMRPKARATRRRGGDDDRRKPIDAVNRGFPLAHRCPRRPGFAPRPVLKFSGMIGHQPSHSRRIKNSPAAGFRL